MIFNLMSYAGFVSRVIDERAVTSRSDSITFQTDYVVATLNLNFHTELQNSLVGSGVSLAQRSSQNIMLTLSTNIYEDFEDTSAAVDVFRGAIAQRKVRHPLLSIIL